MLVAIFILLLIVFFPLLSLFLGVGITALVINYWWVILLFIGFSLVLSYGRKVNEREVKRQQDLEQQQALINAVSGARAEQESKLTFRGEPSLENDSYVLFLAKKYEIEKNDLLGKYVLEDSLYPSLDEALKMADELEIEQRALNEKRNEESALRAIAYAKAQKADNRRLAIGSVVSLFIASICWFYYVYGNKEPAQYAYLPLAPKGETEMRVVPSFDCSKANSPSERLICSDSELATQDNELFELYKRAKVKSDNPAAFKAEAAEAWKVRETNCRDKACLLEWYSNRKTYYEYILNK